MIVCLYEENGKKYDAGDTYLKHNTVVLSDKYVAMSIENGYVGLAKLRAIMKNRKEHLLNKFGTNVAIITMPKSAVKSGTQKQIFYSFRCKRNKNYRRRNTFYF